MSIEVLQEGSKNIPRICYEQEENILRITGRSITEKPELVYHPLETWIINHLKKFNQLRVVIFLEYINSGSSKSLRDVLKILTSYHAPQYRVRITWLYEEDDESMHELGEHYRDSAGVNMEMEMVL